MYLSICKLWLFLNFKKINLEMTREFEVQRKQLRFQNSPTFKAFILSFNEISSSFKHHQLSNTLLNRCSIWHQVPRMPRRSESLLRGVMVVPPLDFTITLSTAATSTNITFTSVKHLLLPSTYRLTSCIISIRLCILLVSSRCSFTRLSLKRRLNCWFVSRNGQRLN